MYMIIYSNVDNRAIVKLDGNQTLDGYCRHFSEEEKRTLSSIYTENAPFNIENYKVADGKLIKMTDEEILELKQYGKVLSEEERQLQKLKPSPEEVKKAEQTIEILTLIQEVI